MATRSSRNKTLKKRLHLVESVLGNKAKEYAVSDDRLHNFRVAAKIQDVSVPKAIWWFMLKHLVSVKDLVDGNIKPTTPLVEEKIGDMINYLILLEGAFKDGKDSV